MYQAFELEKIESFFHYRYKETCGMCYYQEVFSVKNTPECINLCILSPLWVLQDRSDI